MSIALTYDISKRGNVPIYEFLYRCIRNDILRGTLKAGEKLPSKRTLSKTLGVSMVTVENAFHQLVLEGYVESRPRSGYYVQEIGDYPFVLKNTSHFSPALSSSTSPTKLQVIKHDEDEPDATLKANRTGLHEFPLSIWMRLLRKAIAENPPDLYNTVPYNGLPQLRLAIANYLLRARGMNVSPSQIIIGAGTEYLYGRILQLLSPNAIFAFENPGYQKLAHIADNYNVSWTYCNVDRFGMNIARLRSSNANVVHVSPANNFPTGVTMPVGRRRELLEWAHERPNRYIIEDDYDSELRYEGNITLPLFANDSHEKIIYLNTFSKTLMPSLRISYMILPKPLLARYKETMSFYSCTVSGLEQRALAKFIDEGYFERHIVRLRNHYKRQREAVMKAIRASALGPRSHLIENNAGTHFLLHLDTKMTATQIKRAAVNEGIEIALLSDYCFEPNPVADKIIVVNYASLAPEDIDDTVSRLVRALVPEST